MTKDKIFRYDDEQSERIDVFLTKNNEYTRNFFHRVLARGDVLVNWKVVKKKSLKLKAGDEIIVRQPERYMEASRLADSPVLDLQILIEKDDYLVVYKPKWVLSHPNSRRWVEHPNMVWALYHYFQSKNLPSTGNFIRAWLIHRLDKATDGLMLIVKTEAWLKYFKDLFQRKSLAETIEAKEAVPLRKLYRAEILLTAQWKKILSWQSLPITIQELVKPKVPHYTPKMGITKILEWWILNNKWWMNNWKLIIDNYEFLVLNIEILTGRTHQIRYHLSQHGLPVRWDYLYMDKSQYNEEDDLQLTAYGLEFEDIEGERISLSLD